MQVSKVEKYLKTHLESVWAAKSGWAVEEVSSVSGEAHVNVIRGKPKIGYELTYTCKFDKDGDEGSVTITEQCDDDNEGQVSGSSKVASAVAEELMQKVAAIMQILLAEL